jgi:hypothetical protein
MTPAKRPAKFMPLIATPFVIVPPSVTSELRAAAIAPASRIHPTALFRPNLLDRKIFRKVFDGVARPAIPNPSTNLPRLPP